MTVLVAFGSGWHNLQWFLPGTDPSALPGTVFSEAQGAWHPSGYGNYRTYLFAYPHELVPARDALSSAVAEAGAENGPLFGGLVAHRSAGDGEEVFDVVGAWNSVKNVSARIDQPGAYAFDGFVHADVDGREAAGGDGLDLLVRGAKRGNLLAGDGSDRIAVETVWSSSFGVSEFHIGTGAGDDAVRITPLPYSEAVLLRGDPTYAGLADEAGASWSGSQNWTTAFADLGDGNDVFHAPRTQSFVQGGQGDDSIVGNVENPEYRYYELTYDSIEGGAGDDRLSGSGYLLGGDGDDVLTGFGTSSGFFLDDGKTPNSGYSRLYGGAGDDTLAGVADLMVGGGGRDVLLLPGRAEDYVVLRWDIAAKALTFLDAAYRDSPRERYDHSFDVGGVEVIRFQGGGAELLVA